MKSIQGPEVNFDVPDAVLAQSLAADSGWLMDDSGHVYDSHGVVLAESLFALARVMRELGWFTPVGAEASGLTWAEIPPAEVRAEHVWSVSRRREAQREG